MPVPAKLRVGRGWRWVHSEQEFEVVDLEACGCIGWGSGQGNIARMRLDIGRTIEIPDNVRIHGEGLN